MRVSSGGACQQTDGCDSGGKGLHCGLGSRVLYDVFGGLVLRVWSEVVVLERLESVEENVERVRCACVQSQERPKIESIKYAQREQREDKYYEWN